MDDKYKEWRINAVFCLRHQLRQRVTAATRGGAPNEVPDAYDFGTDVLTKESVVFVLDFRVDTSKIRASFYMEQR